MNEEKYKIKFKDHKGNWRYTKSFSSMLSAEMAQLLTEQQLILANFGLSLFEQKKPETEIIEVCPSCESENINTNGGDCYCAECRHKWTY